MRNIKSLLTTLSLNAITNVCAPVMMTAAMSRVIRTAGQIWRSASIESVVLTVSSRLWINGASTTSTLDTGGMLGYAGIDNVVDIANTYVRMCNCRKEIFIADEPDFREVDRGITRNALWMELAERLAIYAF